MDRIKLRITIMAVLAVFLLKGTDTFAQQTDPTLTGAVFAQTSTLKNIYNKRQKAHEKIIAAETAVTVALDRVHSVEDKMLEYLSNAQGAMQNLYQIKRAGELVATEIPQNCSLLLKSVGSNLKGTAIAAIVSDELADAATQMAALYPFMRQLVTSGSYDTGGSDGGKEKHKVNLLSSSERYYIANEVLTRLEAVNTDLFILAWQVRTLSWNDLWFSLDPEGWASVMSGKNIIGGIVADWNREKKIIGRCPFCGSNVVKTCKGYRCENNTGEHPSCVLNINAIIGNRKMNDGEIAEFLEKRRILLDGFSTKEGKTFPTVLELADDGAVNMQSVIGRCPHCGGEVRVGTRAFNCSNYSNQEAPCSFAIWRNIGGHQLTLEEAKELCEKNITSSELEMYREDGSIYRKRLGLAPDKLQIVKI